ncbi:MAG: iditol 2-dehydrogenase [Comamonadaceae bacterium]|nr:MAG: iditol 2-dehydrogenase [Comamonadaceae bacterium]
MKGATFRGDRIVSLENFPDPTPGPGSVVIAVRASGMCGSDLHSYRGNPGGPQNSGALVAGHEPAGVVQSVGPGVAPEVAKVGTRVGVHHYAGCTYCDACRSGWPQMCSTAAAQVLGLTTHGAHAPLLHVPAATLVPLDDRLSFEAGATIGCGTGTAWGALDRLGDIGGSTIAIFGQGPVGLSATMLANARGAQVIAIDVEPVRLHQAEKFGAIATINPKEVAPSDALRDLTGGRGVSHAVETSGASSAASEAIASLAAWGKLCLVGLGGEVNFSVFDYLRSQMTIMTSWTMSIVQQRQCAEFVAQRNLPVDELFSHRWSLDQVAEAYAEFDLQRAGKGVIIFDED